MKHAKKLHKLKKAPAHVKKKIKLWYAKQPLIVIAIAVAAVLSMGVVSYRAYNLSQSNNSDAASTRSTQESLDGNLTDLSDGYKQADKDGKKLDEDGTDEQKESSGGGSSSVSNNNGEENPRGEYLIAYPSVVNLGGFNTNSIWLTVKSSDGNEMPPLTLSPNGSTGALYVQTENFDNPGSGTPHFSKSRKVGIQLTCTDCTGSKRIYVSDSSSGLKGSILVNYVPQAYFNGEPVTVTRSDTSTHAIYTFHITIIPNKYFGNPYILLQISSHLCTNDPTRKFRYNYDNTFSISCNISKSRPEESQGLNPHLQLYMSVSKPSEEGILGKLGPGGYYKLPNGYNQ